MNDIVNIGGKPDDLEFYELGDVRLKVTEIGMKNEPIIIKYLQAEDGEVRLLVVDKHVGVHEQDLGLLWHRIPQPTQDAVKSRIS